MGGAIRDPLSGRSYVYQAMRVTGAADPTAPVADTLPGKLPQRKLTTTAAAGYSSYGNQVGLATGQVSELYHPGYAAKRMEIGAVVGATPANHVRRETPAPGDVVVLLGGRTGRDGIGGATGSSKAHKTESLESCGAEVQKGNAPVERKIQRLFRRGEACRLIKRCNDFGAGGVSVAVGELADGLLVNLDKVPKKYEGLDGTELAIAESQERMAVALAAEDVEAFVRLAHEENLEATPIAEVTEEPRVRMTWRGDVIVDVSRAFLASNGAPKRQRVRVPEQGAAANALPRVPGWDAPTLDEGLRTLLADLNVCCNKGLVERFDSTIGAATVLMPFGGERQLTPAQAMVAKFPVDGETTTCSGMAWGFNPYLSEADQFVGAYVAVVESVAKLVGAGFRRADMYLTFQEYFEKLRDEPERWGKPMASVLGALMAQVDLGVGSIGGKDSMSGSFEQLDVPPTLVSFATAVGSVGRVTSPEFKGAGHPVLFVDPGYEPDGATPCKDGLIEAFDLVERLIGDGVALGVSTCGFGGPAEALFKMCVGNGVGVSLAGDALCGPAPAGPAGSEGAADEAARAATAADGAEAAHAAAAAADGAAEAAEAAGPRRVASLFQHAYGSFVVELAHEVDLPALSSARAQVVGETTAAYAFSACGETLDLASLQEVWESALEDVFPYRSKGSSGLPAGGPADAVAFPSTRSRGDAGDSRTGVRVAPAIPTTSGTGETLADFDGPASGAAAGVDGAVETVSFTGGVPLTYNGRVARPRVVIPVFPGTNCEYDTARAFEAAGAVAEVLVINNLTPEHVAESTQALAQAIGNSQIVMIPGGFSGGDEPDGSAKFITAFFRAPQVTEAVRDLLQNRDGLMLGICNGFQALVKLGLVPFGDIRPMDGECPTLTFNTIGRHQSRLVHTRVASNLSPWLARCEVGDIHTVPVSHGEGRFVAPPALLEEMLANGQVATQYVDARGVPSMDLAVNPNGAVLAIEGITSPDGRVLGKMGHSERRGAGLYKNVPGNQFQPLFEAGVDYFAG